MKVILFQQDARDCLNKKEVWGFCKLFYTPKEAFLPLCSVYLHIMMSCWDFRMSYVLLSDICDTPRVTFIDLDFTSISSTPSRLHQRLLNIFVSDPHPFYFDDTWRDSWTAIVTTWHQHHNELACVSWKCIPAEWREGQAVSGLVVATLPPALISSDINFRESQFSA